jgi:heme a synthase
MDFRARRSVAVWLLICCLMVFATLVVGGVTRLTHSGLSIVEWQPLVGTLPPRGDAAWQDVFAKYQRTPEYVKVNRGMPLDEFKYIFWWEYWHRLLGRAIGIVFLLPLVWFWVRGRLERALLVPLVGMFVLGGLQGAMGWYMVKSGLVDDPRVSAYRLTAHLGLAFVLFAWMLWTALGLWHPRASGPWIGARRQLQPAAAALGALVFAMILSGGLVAGLRAGLVYNTFPLMDGQFVPAAAFIARPLWRNFAQNPATVQFDHRLIGWSLALLVPAFWLWSRRVPLPPRASRAVVLLLAALALQIGLGIATLLLVVPIPLAAAHQAGALLLFGVVLWVNHELRVVA